MTNHWTRMDRTMLAALLMLLAWMSIRYEYVARREAEARDERYGQFGERIRLIEDLVQANRKATVDFRPNIEALCVATGANCPALGLDD